MVWYIFNYIYHIIEFIHDRKEVLLSLVFCLLFLLIIRRIFHKQASCSVCVKSRFSFTTCIILYAVVATYNMATLLYDSAYTRSPEVAHIQVGTMGDRLFPENCPTLGQLVIFRWFSST